MERRRKKENTYLNLPFGRNPGYYQTRKEMKTHLAGNP